MPHGTPDWYRLAPKTTTHQLGDLGEHAVRLGSINAFDRRGDTLFLDSFEDGMAAWSIVLNDPAASATLNAIYPHFGAHCVRMQTGGVLNASLTLDHREPYPALSQMGFEIRVALDSVSNTRIVLEIARFDGTYNHLFQAEYRTDNQTVYITDRVLGAVPLGTLNLYRAPWLYNVFKLVGNISTDRLVRLIINHQAYPLSAYSAPIPLDGAAPSLLVKVWIYAIGAVDAINYLDDAIITQNEP